MPAQSPSLDERVGCLEGLTGELATIIAGTPRSSLQGGGRNQDGLLHKVETLQEGQDWIRDHLQNGGINSKLTGPQKTALWSAAIAAIGTLIAAIVGAIV